MRSFLPFLQHRRLPPVLHFERPNPEIDLAASPFHVNTETVDWETGRLLVSP